MNLLTTIRRAPKQAAVFAALAVAMTGTAFTLAWGPERPTYTIENPAPHVTFNSMTNNPHIGDERNFVGIREKGSTSTWKDTMPVQAGKEYVVRMYVHNNAADNLNLVAENVTAKFNLPTSTAKSIQVNGFLSSTNAQPREVYDHATFTSDRDFNLAYVPGTLSYSNNHFGGNGVQLSESAFTSAGVKLGYDKLDGKIPGCFKYAGYVTFTVKPQVAKVDNFTVSKQVRKAGTTGWNETINAQAGDELEYLITYKNTGEVQQNNVTMRDTLPEDVTYVPGTTYLKNTTNPNGLKVSDNLVTSKGINIGNYAAGATAYVKFNAKVEKASELACGDSTLRNKVRVITEAGYKEDTADVKVSKVCEEVVDTPEEEAPKEEQPKEEAPKDAETPEVIAATGPAQILGGLIGSGALGLGVTNYLRSRRALSDVL